MRRALLLGVVLAIAVPANGARAGTFVVHTCGTIGVNNAWHATPPPPGVMEVNEACHADPQMDGIWVRDVLASSTDLTDGQGAWLQFDAPAGTTIAALTYTRWLWKDAIDDLHPELRTADGTVLETCSINGGSRCDVGGEGTAPVTYTNLSTTRLQAGVRCQISEPFATDCPGGGTEHGYGAVISDAAITIEDDTPPPAPSVANSGLWSGAAWYRGSSSLTVSGADASGIAAIRVYADGQLLTESTPDCDFTHPKPCADAADVQVPVDTTQLADGEHTIAVALVDAAGNESAAVRTTVLVANDPPGAPHVAVTPSQGDSPSFTASWAAAPGHALPIALAHITVCHDITCSHLTSTASSIPLSAPGPGLTTVSVYLEDVAGNADPATATSAAFTLDSAAVPGSPSASSGGPSSPSSGGGHHAAKTMPRLQIALSATSSRLQVRLRADRRVTGSVRIAVRWQVGHGPSRLRWSSGRFRATIRNGRGAVSLKRPPTARLARVVATYGGAATFNAARAQQTIRLR